jgi:hypothetical protein
MQNLRVIQDTVNSQHIGLSGEREDFILLITLSFIWLAVYEEKGGV